MNILTGIKPTGIPHIGNYLGVIKSAIEMSNNSENEYFYFIADYHALTTVKTAKELKEYSNEIACVWLACGLDPEKVVFYKQSDIPQTCELTTILSNVTPKGLMNRAHAYKAMVQKNQEENLDKDVNINMGLYNYPILMAADILLFNTKQVPVGQDQRQHIEIARDIAKSFNKVYGKTLVVPTDLVSETVGTVMGLDGRKMSKSYNNVIPVFCSENELKKMVSRIQTDSSLPNEPKNIDCAIFNLYSYFSTVEEIVSFKKKFDEGISWADAKNELFEKINKTIKPMREKYDYYKSNPELVNKILIEGANKAQKIAKQTIQRVRSSVGL